MAINIIGLYCGDHFAKYTNVKSLCCTPESMPNKINSKTCCSPNKLQLTKHSRSFDTQVLDEMENTKLVKAFLSAKSYFTTSNIC